VRYLFRSGLLYDIRSVKPTEPPKSDQPAKSTESTGDHFQPFAGLHATGLDPGGTRLYACLILRVGTVYPGVVVFLNPVVLLLKSSLILFFCARLIMQQFVLLLGVELQ
jgi:hypothetical protein